MSERFALGTINDERTARIALSYAVPVGHELTGRLLHQYGALQTLQFALGSDPPGVDRTTLTVWRSHFDGYEPQLVARGFDLAEQHNLVAIVPGDDAWPTGVDDLRDRAPAALWTRGGRPELLNRPLWERATITGARAAGFSGMWDAQQLSVGLALRNISIVTSAQRGVSRMALAGTLDNENGAIAVFSSGLDDLYPSTPNGFFDTIAEQGILVSETPPGVRPSRDSLQGASRIIAALSAVTTVVESGPRGLAMDTAAHARNLRRHVAAVRGPEDEIGSLGTNMLIDHGVAISVMDRDDVMSALENFRRKSDFITAVSEPLHQAQSAIPEELQRPQSPLISGHDASRSL